MASVSERAETRWRATLSIAAAELLLLLAACATPVQVERADPRAVQRQLTSNVISTGDISEPTQVVLHREDLTERFASDPEGAIVSLHRIVTAAKPDPDALFALAEMSFRHAEDTGKLVPMLAAKGMFDLMKARHQLWMQKYPNTPEARGYPFTGLENPRPAT